MEIQDFLEPFCPWHRSGPALDAWKQELPAFSRPVYDQLISDIDAIEQIISVTGPRRVGKSTILKQIVRRLVYELEVDPRRVIYYSLDDPALFLRNVSGGALIEKLMDHARQLSQKSDKAPVYLFLDEIQTLDRWEQYLKKYYDLKYPVRVVISGSASSPIFKKSRESLLGRVKDYHLLPFSFREYALYMMSLHARNELITEIEQLAKCGEQIKGMFCRSPEHADLKGVDVRNMSPQLWEFSEIALNTYFVEGGFPEVWKLPNSEKKMEYLYDNQVKKVITEDLVLAVEFRKPEQLKTFYISLLEQPGREVNMTSLSQDIGVNVQQIEKYLPLLEMTDLIRHASKFRKSPTRVRRGNQKFYPVDMALRNSVLRIGQELLQDAPALGLYAETLVFNALTKWKGVLAIDYFREGKYEVDFVVHTNPSRYLPIEVKYQNTLTPNEVTGLLRFRNRYHCHVPLLVTKGCDDFGPMFDGMFCLPLPCFLFMFD